MDIRPFIDNYVLCVELVKDNIVTIKSKTVMSSLSLSEQCSINNILGQIYLRNIAEDGLVYMTDEINPLKVTNYLCGLDKYDIDREDIYSYVCRYAQKRINRFYESLKEGNESSLIISLSQSKILNKRETEKAIALYRKKIEIRKKSKCRLLRGI